MKRLVCDCIVGAFRGTGVRALDRGPAVGMVLNESPPRMVERKRDRET